MGTLGFLAETPLNELEADLEKIVAGDGVVEFSELGNNKPVEGTTELSQVMQDKLDTGALKITDLDAPILGLGDLSKYNLEKWREKSEA